MGSSIQMQHTNLHPEAFRTESLPLSTKLFKTSLFLKTMGFRLPGIKRSSSFSRKSASSRAVDVPKGFLSVYVGDEMKRFVIPISYLNHPLFRDLLDWAEEEFGYSFPKGGLTIPCTEDYFINLTSSLGYS